MREVRKRILSLWWIAVVLFHSIPHTRALIFLSEENNVEQSGGTLNNRHLVTYRCEAADLAQDASFSFSVQAQDGSSTPLQIDCIHPEEDTSPLLWGFIPEKIDSAVSDAMAVNDPVAYTNITAAEEYSDLTDPMGRVLLHLKGITRQGREVMAEAAEFLGVSPMGRKTLGFLDSLKDAALGFTCAGGLGVVPVAGAAVGGAIGAAGLCDKGNGGISQSDLDAVRNTASAAMSALGDLTAKENAVSNDLIVLQTLDQKRFELQKDINSENDKRFAAQQSEVLATNAAVNTLASKLTEQDNVFHKQIIATNTNVASLASQMQTEAINTGRTFDAFAANLAVIQAELNGNVHNVTSLFTSKIQRLVDQIRSVSRNLGDTQSTFDVFYRDEQFIHMHTAQLQPKQQDWINGGIFDPFVIDQGAVPADPVNLGTSSTYRVEVSSLKYIRVDTDGQPWAVQTTREYRCSSLFMVYRPQLSVSTRQAAEQVGPTNCSATVEGNNMCRCSVKYTSEITCPFKTSSPGVADAAALSDYLTNEAIVQSTHCASPITHTFLHPSESLEGFVATDLNYHLDAEAKICKRGSYPGSDVMVISSGKGVKLRTSFTSAMCNQDWHIILDPTPEESANIVTAFYQHLQVAFRLAKTNFEPIRRLIVGRPPDPATQLSGTYRALPDTSSGRWSQWIMTAHSKNKIPVSVIRQTATSAVPNVLVNGSPVIPDSVVFHNPDAIYLPYGLAMVGDPFSETIAYNQRTETVPINPVATGRCGTLTYPICGCEDDTELTPTHCPDDNIGTWEVVNGLLYDHQCGIASAESWLVNLDSNPSSPTFGFCMSGPGNGTILAGGNWCNLRATHKVEVNRGQNRVTYIPRAASLDVTVAIPEGQIVALQTSQCPAFPLSIPAPGFVGVKMQNLANTDNKLFLTEGPGCTIPSQYTSVTIQAFASIDVIVPQCQRTPAGQVEHISVFYEKNNVLIQCPTQVNVTVSATDASLFTGVMVEHLRQITTDSVFSMLHIVMAQNMALQLQSNTMVFNALNVAGIKLDPISLSAFTDIVNNATLLFNITQQTLIDSRNSAVTNFTDLLVPYNEQIANAAAIFDAAQAAAVADNIVLGDLNDNGTIALKTLVNDTVALIKARIVFRDAFDDFANAIVNALDDLKSKPGGLGWVEWAAIIAAIIIFVIILMCVCMNCVQPKVFPNGFGPAPTAATTKGLFQKLSRHDKPPEVVAALDVLATWLESESRKSALQTGKPHAGNLGGSDSGSDNGSRENSQNSRGSNNGEPRLQLTALNGSDDDTAASKEV